MRNVLLATFTALSIAACVSNDPGDPGNLDFSAGGDSSAGNGAGAVSGVGGNGTAGAGTAGAGTAGAGTAGAGTAGAGTAGAGTAGAGTAGAGTAGAGTAGAGTAGAGTAGGPPAPVYGHGVQSGNITTADAATAYSTWKSAKLKTCSGELRVDNDSGQTVSEGIGYGMLLAVGNNDQTTFDGLWNYYSHRKDGNGLMNWRYVGCNTSPDQQNGATDGDLDTAMALLQAAKKWGGGSYSSNATALISAIKQHEVSGSTLLPGDMGFSAPCVNYSYFAPGYYRVFASVTGDSSWSTLADSAISQVTSAGGTDGLVPDWQSSCPSTETNKNNYYYDAARTPWRIAVDFVWWGTPAASTYLNKLVTFAGSNISTIRDGYHTNGMPLDSTGPNSTFVGAFACAGMAGSQALIDNYAFSFKSLANETGYYDLSLRALYMLLLSGNFVRTT